MSKKNLPPWSKGNEKIEACNIAHVGIMSDKSDVLSPHIVTSKNRNDKGMLVEPITGLKSVVFPIMQIIDQSTEGLGKPPKVTDGEKDKKEEQHPDQIRSLFDVCSWKVSKRVVQ